MTKMKLARSKKKEAPPNVGAFGCISAIVLLLALFIWLFWAALRP